MDDRAYWQKQLEEAGRELAAARGRTAINAAAQKSQQAKAELKRLAERSRSGQLLGPGGRTLPLHEPDSSQPTETGRG